MEYAILPRPSAKNRVVRMQWCNDWANYIPAIAKNTKLVVVPNKPMDLAGVVATTMSIAKTIDASVKQT